MELIGVSPRAWRHPATTRAARPGSSCDLAFARASGDTLTDVQLTALVSAASADLDMDEGRSGDSPTRSPSCAAWGRASSAWSRRSSLRSPRSFSQPSIPFPPPLIPMSVDPGTGLKQAVPRRPIAWRDRRGCTGSTGRGPGAGPPARESPSPSSTAAWRRPHPWIGDRLVESVAVRIDRQGEAEVVPDEPSQLVRPRDGVRGHRPGHRARRRSHIRCGVLNEDLKGKGAAFVEGLAWAIQRGVQVPT